MTETWAPVAGYEGRYDVSDLGRVRGWFARGQRLSIPHERVLTTNNHGYVQVTLYIGSKGATVTVHSLVLTAFKGPRPDGLVGAHRDGDKANCRLDNLNWKSQADNIRDKERHGTKVVGADHHAAKLSEVEVVSIRRLRSRGWTLAQIADRFGVTTANIQMIASGKTWKHVA